ncbi:MAG: adenosine deaminase [Clostridia bacterium]|nr:adenosine deaminase [Clostridia bacterium]
MKPFQRFYLDKEKDMIVDLFLEDGAMSYVLRTPNHHSGNLISNLSRLCGLPASPGEDGLAVIRGQVPCYVDGYNRKVYIFRLGNTKVANIYPDGKIEMKAQVPSISKTLMSQTKDYRLNEQMTIVKTYIRSECKFRTDLHTHMNAILSPDILIALGIAHGIRYPLYYIKKLGLRVSDAQKTFLDEKRKAAEEKYKDYSLTGKYMDRRIDDNTFINFAYLILGNPEDAPFNIARIRCSLAVLKDGQAVFTNLEKVYLYRYVFTKGIAAEDPFPVSRKAAGRIPDDDIRRALLAMLEDKKSPSFRNNSLFQDKLLWIARSYAAAGISYVEITDTSLVKKDAAAHILAEVHEVMPAVTSLTGVTIRFLAGIRRIPLTIIRHKAAPADYFRENLSVLRSVASDPYVAGSDIIGEEINNIRDLKPVIHEIVSIASEQPGFVVRIHAGENDSLRDNVANSIRCVKESLLPGQRLPRIRIGHGLYTANLRSAKGKALVRDLLETDAVLEFQITSNVRLNNLSAMETHPLRAYLHAGVSCVQGTDGGAIYGTDSIDEQLALEKMLGLSFGDLCRMRECEEAVRTEGLRDMDAKQAKVRPSCGIEEYYREKIEAADPSALGDLPEDRRKNAAALLADRIEVTPDDLYPVVICGGSFNNDSRTTKVRESAKSVIDGLLKTCDPQKYFFVVGHRISGYERYLIEKNAGRFAVFAFVPALRSPQSIRLFRESGVRVRVAIESEAMGIYKSISYEIFKRRESTLIALDGNSAGVNLIQEAKNAKYRCDIYVSSRARVLRSKAKSLKGYVTLLPEGEPFPVPVPGALLPDRDRHEESSDGDS